MKAKTNEKVNTISDEYGNNVVIKNNGARIILSLKLRSESRSRRIGTINIGTNTMYVKRVREKHLFQKNRSYGFNYKILIEAKKFDKVRLTDEHNEWLIPVDFILKNGSFLHFMKEGFEKQIFIQLSAMSEFERGLKIWKKTKIFY